MKKCGFIIWISIALIGVPELIFSQSGFNQIYEIGRSVWFKSIILIDSNEIIVSGPYYNHTSNKQNIIIVSIDTFGHILKSVSIEDPAKSSHLTMNDAFDMTRCNANDIVMPFGFYNRNTMGIAFVNLENESVEIKEYVIDTIKHLNPEDIICVSDGYLITGSCEHGSDIPSDAFLLKVAKNGHIKWIKVFGREHYYDVLLSVSPVNDNKYILGGTTVHSDNYDARSWILTVDSLGNKLNEWVSDTSEIKTPGIWALEYDSITQNIYYLSIIKRKTTYPDKFFDVSAPLLFIRNQNMDLIFVDSIQPFALSNELISLVKGKKSAWISCGYTTLTGDSFISPTLSSHGTLVKVNSEGIVQWSLKDPAIIVENYGSRSILGNLIEIHSGSIFAVGETHDFNQDSVLRGFGWIIKVTEDGCIDTLCLTTNIENEINEPFDEIILYPNPAVEYVNISQRTFTEESMDFVLFDINGNFILKEEITSRDQKVMLRNIVSGIYFWRIYSVSAIIEARGKLIIID